jgi:hypothetical protein
MSSAKYYIRINNKSADNQQYLIFNEPPQASTNVGKAWANVWIKTGGTPTPNGSQKITISTENFAVCGTTNAPLSTGVSVEESDWAPVTLKNQSVQGTAPVMDVVNGTPAFTKPYKAVELANSFGIITNPFNPDQFRMLYSYILRVLC